MKANFVTASQAAAMLESGNTVATVGMSLVGAAESILKAVEKRFQDTGTPSNLTLVHAAGQSDRVGGILHFAHEGMTTRIIGGHWGLAPRWMELITGDKVEAFNLPQGQLAQLFRSMACGLPGKMSRVGLGTYIDPRVEGGKMNPRTRKVPDIVEVMNYNNEEYLFYKAIPLDCVIIRGTTADEMGNISFEEEAMKLEVIGAVMAAKRYGGKVLVQVKRVAKNGFLHPKNIVIPGYFVDAIVVCEDVEADHRQSHSFVYDPSLCGDLLVPETALKPLPLSIRKVIGRRAISEVTPGSAINLGIGIPNDVIGGIINEEGLSEEILLTVESGLYGGVPEGGMDFGVAHNTSALLEHTVQMDFYNGMGIPFAFMGAGEMDANGHVNATKFGDRCTGCGGFIDITQNARHVVFCSTFTARGLEVDFVDGKLKIIKEGQEKKLVERVAQISFNGEIARKKKQKVFFVTERAVFELREEGPVLIEIASGINLEKDVLGQMGFVPVIDKNLKTMDPALYSQGAFGLKKRLLD